MSRNRKLLHCSCNTTQNEVEVLSASASWRRLILIAASKGRHRGRRLQQSLAAIKAKEVQLLRMHTKQEQNSRLKHRKKGRLITSRYFATIFFMNKIVLTHRNLQGTMSTIGTIIVTMKNRQ